MQIGYARVSSAGQNLDRQLGALRAQRCDRVFTEKASGKSLKGRPELEKAIDQLGTGDVLVVAEWDRATRSMMDGIRIMQRVHARGAAVKVLDKPHLDLTSPIGRGFLAFLSALAEDEREHVTGAELINGLFQFWPTLKLLPEAFSVKTRSHRGRAVHPVAGPDFGQRTRPWRSRCASLFRS